MKNKYEDIEMIELADREDIIDIFMESMEDTTETIGLVADKELIEYAMDEVLALDDISVQLVDLTGVSDANEYFISVDREGCVTVMPVDSFGYLEDIDIVYIDMDGTVDQDTIDYCLYRDKDVILFGMEDSDDECDEYCGDCECCHDYNCLSSISTTSYKVNGKTVSKEEYVKALEKIEDRYLDNIRDMLLNYCEIQDEMNEWRKVIRW